MTTKTVDMSERAFQASVLDYAERLNWKTAHFHDSRREVRRRDGSKQIIGDKAAAGFPDLVLVRADRLIFAELKREKGKLSDNQAEWLSILGGVEQVVPENVEVWIWRPSDWPQIEEVLR